MKGLSAAFKTLTVIPFPGKESADLARSLPWFPVVGFVLGGITYGIGHVLMSLPFFGWEAGAALFMVGAEIFLTRGLHLDGLADWADSIGGFRQKEKRLEIMKDMKMGAFGVLALILALMAKWVAFERCLVSGSAVWIPAIFALSRGMLVELSTTIPYARTEDGMAKPFVSGSSSSHRAISHLLCAGFCLLFGPVGVGFFVLAWLITLFWGFRCRYSFGGVTGDLLGAANEIIEISLLWICVLAGTSLASHTGWGWVF